MKLYIVRHSEAIERNSTIPEELRYLTPKGRTSFRKTGAVLKRKGVLPNVILTSPLIRAVQTADILAETLAFDDDMIVVDELAPGFDIQALYRLIASFGTSRKIAIVGHEPDLGNVASALLKLDSPFGLKKGAVVALELDPADMEAAAQFRWMVHNGKKPIKVLEDAIVE